MKAKPGLAVAAVAILGLLTGCAPTVALKPAADATSAACAGVIARLPRTVSTLDQRETNAQGTSAWGTPADIYLRCGVAVPAPTSTLVCITVDGVDWLRNDSSAPLYVFTTYGRTPAVAVTVNSKNVNADGNAALTDVEQAVASIRSQHRCIATSEVLRGGQPVDPTTPTPGATPTPGPTP
ncbi:MAG: hypothetical protein JWR36_466 [Glaciihabitans sp.]|jgi:hypothetical protein|nr:hypothetical protein [Glaciihabitans sp.]MDQ1571338.1 hypothetical protein [Actinomycetota bacterium]